MNGEPQSRSEVIGQVVDALWPRFRGARCCRCGGPLLAKRIILIFSNVHIQHTECDDAIDQHNKPMEVPRTGSDRVILGIRTEFPQFAFISSKVGLWRRGPNTTHISLATLGWMRCDVTGSAHLHGSHVGISIAAADGEF
jgi:hypothetical protein